MLSLSFWPFSLLFVFSLCRLAPKDFNNGEVTHHELEEFCHRHADRYSGSVFLSLIAHDYGTGSRPGFLQLHDFLSMVESICMMTDSELLHMAFTECQYKQPPPDDPLNFEPEIDIATFAKRFPKHIDHEVNKPLLKEFDLVSKRREHKLRGAKGAKAVVESGELTKCNYREFEEMNRRSPEALYPLFWLQHEWQRVTFGTKFWRKRRKELPPGMDLNQEHCDKVQQAHFDAAARIRRPRGQRRRRRRRRRRQ